MEENKINEEITIKLHGLELTVDEACQLYEELDKIFNQSTPTPSVDTPITPMDHTGTPVPNPYITTC